MLYEGVRSLEARGEDGICRAIGKKTGFAHLNGAGNIKYKVNLENRPTSVRVYEPVHGIGFAVLTGLAFNTDKRPVVIFGHVSYTHFQGDLISVPVGMVQDDFPVTNNIGHDSYMAQRHSSRRPERHDRSNNRFGTALIDVVRPIPPVLGVATNINAA